VKRYRSDGLEPILCLAVDDVVHFEHGASVVNSSRASSNDTPWSRSFRDAFSASHSKGICQLLS